MCKCGDCLFGAVDFGEPTWRSRKERQPAHQKDAGDELDAPCSSERSLSGDETAAIADEIHDQDSPFYPEVSLTVQIRAVTNQ